jgi:hypothetical protein
MSTKSASAFLSLLLVLQVMANARPLISAGEQWSYWKTAPGADAPHPRWHALDFDDSNWRTAPAGFELPEEQPALTLFAPPQVAKQVFIRNRFNVTNRSEIRWLLLRVEHEDGFIAYLNGVEVGRHQGPGVEPFIEHGEVEHIVRPVTLDLSRFRDLLKEGANVLALRGANSPQSVSAFALAGTLLANFSRDPFVQNPTTNSIQIIWRTPAPGSTFVEFGTTTNLGTIVTNSVPMTNHVVTLTNLSPNTTYYYRVGTEAGVGAILSSVAPLRTLKMEGPIRFAFVGDTGQNSTAQRQIATVLRDLNPEIVLHGGDVIYGGFTDATADTRFFDYYQAQLRSTPWFLSVGNHDLNCCGGTPDNNTNSWAVRAANFQNTFYLPTNSATGTEHFYSFDHGDVHFVALFNPWFTAYVPTAASDQFQWLTNDLAASSKPWKMLFCHMPVANSGSHASADYDSNRVLDRVEFMNLLLPVAQQYGVQVIFSGHEHNFERFAPTNGFHSVVSGGGGTGLYALSASPHPASAQFWSTNHCSIVSVDGDTMTVQALGLTGQVFDSLTVQKALPPRQVYQAAWNSPVIETSAANDNDGNITGQTFNLSGPPILTRVGQFSNLGRVYVNNDATHLYLGVDQAMYYRDNNIFLFLESPRQPGVASMAGLGNGQVDPNGQGADGLDCLENLSFTNFAPSIACVLGDEFADKQSRSLTRSNLTLNIGQGVFRLDASLSDVPGIRLQQFNRSPQTGRVAYEQNADFIELAIPLSELGNPQPGDVIKLGALVGGGGFDPAAQTRDLDTSVLGYSHEGSGQGPVLLEGVSVRLAADPALSLRVVIETLGPQQYRLSWGSVAGLKYDIEYSEDLTNFARLNDPALPRMATAANETFIVNAPGQGGFYRIKVVP